MLVANPVQSGTNQSAGYASIITLVGTGGTGNVGDGGLGKQATVGANGITGLSIDSTGKLYFTDRVNNRVRVFDQVSGLVNGFAGASGFNGDGPCLSTLLNNPTGLAIDAANNTYVADTGNNIIRKIDASCNVTTIAGILPRNSTGTNAGNATAEGIDALSATLNQPTGVAVDSTGTLYFADIGSNRIRKIANGLINTVAGSGTFTADGLPGTLVSLNLSGGTTQNTKRFTGVAVDSKGIVYFTEPGNNVIRKIQADGTLVTIAGQRGVAGSGGEGGPAVNMLISNPTGIAVDKDGNIFFADTGNFAAHVITANGIALPLAGQTGNQSNDSEVTNPGGPAWARRYRAIQGVAVDNKGNVYLTDTTNNKVDRIPYAAPAACFAATGCPANSTQFSDYRVAGNLGNTNPEFVFDYTAPANATASASTVQLSFPTGIAVDSKGNVFFTDTANNLIREAVVPASN